MKKTGKKTRHPRVDDNDDHHYKKSTSTSASEPLKDMKKAIDSHASSGAEKGKSK